MTVLRERDRLSVLGLLEPNATNWVAYKQQGFVSHSSGSL